MNPFTQRLPERVCEDEAKMQRDAGTMFILFRRSRLCSARSTLKRESRVFVRSEFLPLLYISLRIPHAGRGRKPAAFPLT